MTRLYNLVWTYPLPPEPRELAVACFVTNTVVVHRTTEAVIVYPCLMTPCVYRKSADDPWLELLVASKDVLTPTAVNLQLKVSTSLAAEKRYHREALFASPYGTIEVEEAKPDGDGLVRTHAKFAGVLHELVRQRLDSAGLKKLYRVHVHYDALINAEDAKTKLRPEGLSKA